MSLHHLKRSRKPRSSSPHIHDSRMIRAAAAAMESLEGRVLLSGATDVFLAGGNLLVTDAGNTNDTLTISRDGANVRINDPNNPLAAGSGANQVDANTVDVPLVSILGNIQVNTGAGNDTLTADTSNGLMPSIAYDGGAGFDTLKFTGTTPLDSVAYNYGSDPSSGSIDLALGGVTESVQYANIEPILDNVPATTATINGTNGDNAISYKQGPGGGIFTGNTGLITVDNQESYEFNNKTNLVINGMDGSDTINLNYNSTTNPAGLTGTITVNGGDPTASDTLIVNGISGALDNLRYQPTSAGAGTVINDSEPQPNVLFTGVEHLRLVAQQADGDGFRIDGTTGNDAFQFSHGQTSDTGTLLGTMDQNNATGSGPFTMTPMTYSGASPLANDLDVNFFNPGGTDTFAFDGTAANDNIVVQGGEAGGTDFRNTLNGIVVSRLEVFNIASGLVRGLGGSDTFTVNTPAGPSAVALTVQGNGTPGDTLNYIAPAGAATTIDYGLSKITSTGPAGNPVTFSAIGIINETSSGGGSTLTILGTAGNDNLGYTPTGATAGRVTLADGPTVTFTGVGSTFTLDPLGGIDTVTVNGNALSNQITLTGVLGAPTVQVDALKTVTLSTANTEALVIDAGLGNDNLTVNSATAPVLIPITYDGGGGTDGLTLTGGVASSDTYTSGPQPGAGSSVIVFTSGGGGAQVVNFLNLEPVTDQVAGTLTVSGTTGADNIDYAQGPTAADGEVAVNGFEPIIFKNKTTLTLDGGFGNDAFTIDNSNTPTGLTGITVKGGIGIDSLLVNAYGNVVDVSTPGAVNVTGLPPVGYSGIESINIINALDIIVSTPVAIIAAEGQALSNISVGSFTGGPVGAVAGDFAASIDWGDGQTTAGTVSGSAGSFTVTGSHTYAEEGGYSPVVTVTDPKTVSSTSVGGVPITVSYTAPLSSAINDSATISDPQLTNLATATLPSNRVEGSAIGAITGIATFTDPGGAGVEPIVDFTATINWGDATSSAGTIVSLGGGNYRVDAPTHTYAEEGTFTVNVTLQHDLLAPVTTPDKTITIKDAPLTASGTGLNGIEGRVLSGTVSNFKDAYAGAPVGDFTATVNWGDGQTSAGTIISDGGGKFHVTGSHVYAEQAAGYAVKVTITDIGGSSVVSTGVARIADAPLDSGGGVTLSKSKNVTYTNLALGSFRDQDSLNTLGTDYVGTIDWGDGSAKTTAKFVFAGSTFNVGSFWSVQGTHKYTRAGNFTVKITVKDAAAPSATAPLVITSLIKVT